MDRSVKTPRTTPDLDRVAQELMDRSPQFEPFVPSWQRSSIEGLSHLGELEILARQSLPRPPEAELKPKTLAAKVQLPKKAPLAEPIGDLVQPGYMPALKNPSVVEALLAFHRGSQGGPQPRDKKPAKMAQAKPTEVEIPEGFSSPQVPQMTDTQFTVKKSVRSISGGCTSILRPSRSK